MKELYLKHDRANPENDAKVLELYMAAIRAYDSLISLETMLDEFEYTDAEKASFEMNKVDTRKWRIRLSRAIQTLKGMTVTGVHFKELLNAFVAEGKETETKEV